MEDFAATALACGPFACLCAEGAQVSLTQLPNHDAKGLDPCLSMLGGSECSLSCRLSLRHTCMPGQGCAIFPPQVDQHQTVFITALRGLTGQMTSTN